MKLIKEWQTLTNKITEEWIREYFEFDEGEEVDFCWVANDIGGIFEVSDYYINFSDILACYKHKITKEQFHNWYSYCLEEPYINISIAKFILSPEEKAKKELESLEISRKNVIFAQEEFNKAMEKYGKIEK